MRSKFLIILLLAFSCQKKDYRLKDEQQNQGIVIIAFDDFLNKNINLIYTNEIKICSSERRNNCYDINLLIKHKELSDSSLKKTGKVIGNVFIVSGLVILSLVTNGNFLYGGDQVMMKFNDYEYRNDFNILLIPEGDYYIKSLKFSDGSNISVKNYFEVFTIKSNEVLYIGNLSGKIDKKGWLSKCFDISIKDESEKVALYTRQKFSFILPDQIQKRLLIVGNEAKKYKCNME